jgi:hypothetical protein
MNRKHMCTDYADVQGLQVHGRQNLHDSGCIGGISVHEAECT